MEVSKYDIDALAAIRANVTDLIRRAADMYDKKENLVIDIAPDVRGGAAQFFKNAEIFTIGLSGCDSEMDICSESIVVKRHADVLVCTEVLEHVFSPEKAVENILKMLKTNGVAVVSVPFNFRIHGPLPDRWRFTEHGLRSLFYKFEILELRALESDRFLAPLHYTLIARKQF